MFDISFSELLLIGVVALVVIGPERLPKVARTVGHLVGRAQRYVNDVKSDIQREINANEITNLKDEMQQAASSLKASFTETSKDLRESVEDVQKTVENTADALKDSSSLLTKPEAKNPSPASTPPAASPESDNASRATSVPASQPLDNTSAQPNTGSAANSDKDKA